MTSESGQTKNIVIVGGGFCGALVARKLDHHRGLHVTLVDPTSAFEYIPGLPRIPFRAGVARKLSIPYDDFLPQSRVIVGKAKCITPAAVSVAGEEIPYDACVVCTGTSQPVFLDDRSGVHTLNAVENATALRKVLPAARHILIVGGGILGTEFAAEVVTRAPEKAVTIVHGKSRLIERNPPKASAYAQRFLKSRNVEIILNERVEERRGNSFVTSSGREIRADLALWSAGIRPNPPAMESFSESIFTQHRALRVNGALQLHGYPNVFVGGDLTDVEEEKTARNAERHGDLIAENVQRLLVGNPLTSYRLRTGPLVISLGAWRGIVTYNSHCLNGRLPGLLKWLIEAWVLFQYRGRG